MLIHEYLRYSHRKLEVNSIPGSEPADIEVKMGISLAGTLEVQGGQRG